MIFEPGCPGGASLVPPRGGTGLVPFGRGLGALRRLVAVATLLVLFGAPLVAAQRKVPLSMLCRHAERIVVGEVVDLRVTKGEWPGAGTITVTEVTLEITEHWKGAGTPERITVVVPGGTDPETGVTLTASGAPVFHPGEKALVFVDVLEDGTMRVYAWEQGKYTVVVKRVVGRAGHAIESDVLVHPLRKRIDAELAKLPKTAPAEGGTRASEPPTEEGGNR